MSAAVGYALLSLLMAGVSDVVFKRHSTGDRSRGMYLVGMGLVWTVLQAGIVVLGTAAPRFDANTVMFGLAAGAVVALSNALLVESLRRIDVGLASTVYRLNTIGVVILAVLLLHEVMTPAKTLGVLLGVASVALLFEPRKAAASRDGFMPFFALVVAASFLRACFGVLSKAAALRGVDLQVMLLLTPPLWIVVGSLYAVAQEGRLSWPTPGGMGYALVSGILVCAIANFLMLAVARGDASVVLPLANMGFVVAVLLSAILGMERITRRKVAALVLACAAIIALAH